MSEEQGPRYAPGAFIFILVMCLVFAAGSAKKANDRALAAEQAKADGIAQLQAMLQGANWTIERLQVEKRALSDEFEAAKDAYFADNDRLKAELRKCRGDKGHDTPIFAPEWTYR